MFSSSRLLVLNPLILSIIVLLSSFSFVFSSIYASPSELAVHFIDIGQGDSALIQSPTGKTILIDSGPRKSKNAFFKYLNEIGVKHIDLMINSHPLPWKAVI